MLRFLVSQGVLLPSQGEQCSVSYYRTSDCKWGIHCIIFKPFCNCCFKFCIFRMNDDFFIDCDAKLEVDTDRDVQTWNCSEEDLMEDLDDDEYLDCHESFDIELEPSFKLPYSMAADTDPACLLLDKLIRDGKLSRNSYFYKNLFEVAKHLEDPSSKWDPEVCEALMSIRHLGGKANMNHVIGPLSRGQGRVGRKNSARLSIKKF